MNQEELSKSQLSLVSTSTLPTNASKIIRAVAIDRLKKLSRMRQFGNVVQLGKGQRTYEYFTFDEMTAAINRAEGAAPTYEDANATETVVTVEEINKAFKCTWEANNLKQINIVGGQTRQAVQIVTDSEDNKIVDQMVTDTGNTAAGTDWSSNNADPIKDIVTAKRQVRNKGYKADSVVLNDTNNEELESVIASNAWYGLTEDVVRGGDDLPLKNLKRITTSNQVLGTATVFQSGRDGAFELGIADDMTTHVFDDLDARVKKVQVYERLKTAIVRPNAVATITGL